MVFNDDGTNKPSQALFYLAIVVGVLIALLFIFFSVRYFVRAKVGLSFANSSAPDLRELSREVLYNNFVDPSSRAVAPVGLGRFGVVVTDPAHRPVKLSKRFRLTDEELDAIFVKKTYSDWVNERLGEKSEVKTIDEKSVEKKTIEEKTINEKVDEKKGDDHDNGVSNIGNDKNVSDVESQKEENQPPKEEKSEEANQTSHINTLLTDKKSTILQELQEYDQDACAICLEAFEDSDLVRVLDCEHVFHKECVDPWLTNRKACCPLCKRDYYLKSRLTGASDSYEFLTEEEVARLREAERLTAESRRSMLEFALFGQDGNGNQENLANNIDAFNEYLELSRPLQVRASNALVRRPELYDEAVRKVEESYYSWRQRIFWCIMGITKQDLINSVIVATYEQTRDQQASIHSEPSVESVVSAPQSAHVRRDVSEVV